VLSGERPGERAPRGGQQPALRRVRAVNRALPSREAATGSKAYEDRLGVLLPRSLEGPEDIVEAIASAGAAEQVADGGDLGRDLLRPRGDGADRPIAFEEYVDTRLAEGAREQLAGRCEAGASGAR
jgi:hypothetical protein